MSRSRHLSPEEEHLWRMAMRGTAPLAGQRGLASTVKDPRDLAPKDKSTFTKQPTLSPGPLQGAPKQPQRKTYVAPPADALDNLDRRSAQRVRRGKIEVEGKIDLHGFRQVDAHQHLIRFILAAASQGKRVVLVVTGKGKPKTSAHAWARPGPDDHFTGRGEGVLKSQVPMWLGQSPLRERIFSIQQAHQRHGGSGALYVFLRK